MVCVSGFNATYGAEVTNRDCKSTFIMGPLSTQHCISQ